MKSNSNWYLCLPIFFSFFLPVSAHPLDISSSTFTIQGSKIEAITYLHPSEVEAIIGAQGILMRNLTYENYYEYQSYLFDYLTSKVIVTDSEKLGCVLENFSTQELGVDEIFTKGFPISYTIVCQSATPKFLYELNIFTELPLQTNRILWYDGKTGNSLSYKVLTSKISKAEFTLDTPKDLLDSDADGLPDEEEVLYRTDPNNQDTDRDFYTDNEEVMLGWNPISKEVSPGQAIRMSYPSVSFSLPSGISQQSSNDNKNSSTTHSAINNTSLNQGTSNNFFSRLFNTQSFEIFGKILRYFEQIRKDDAIGSLLPALGLLFILGGLHALGPGHSKGFMAGYILTEGVGLFKSLLYAGLFTIIHLSDIVIITLLAKFVFSTFDSAKYFSEIQQYSALLLILVALLLFVSSIIVFFKVRNTGKSSLPAPFKGGLWMAFFAGLAPCTFAWSLLLVLFATGRADLILPCLGAFGLGVFIALSLVALTIYYLREKVLRLGKQGSVYILPIVSSSILLILSGTLAYQVFG